MPEAFIGSGREIDRLCAEMLRFPTLQKVVALREDGFGVGIEDAQIERAVMTNGIATASRKICYLFVRQLGRPTHVRQYR